MVGEVVAEGDESFGILFIRDSTAPVFVESVEQSSPCSKKPPKTTMKEISLVSQDILCRTEVMQRTC